MIGYVPADLDVQFPYPLMCEAGNYVHIILCVPLGTATGSEVFIGTVMINGVDVYKRQPLMAISLIILQMNTHYLICLLWVIL